MGVLTQLLRLSKLLIFNQLIIFFSGELTLVDWKTVNKTSGKSNSTTEKLTSDLYSNPIQIAAYVAAVNSDPAYKSFPTIKRAAIVLAYEDGRGVEVVSMNEDDIEVSYEFYLNNNSLFSNTLISFVND